MNFSDETQKQEEEHILDKTADFGRPKNTKTIGDYEITKILQKGSQATLVLAKSIFNTTEPECVIKIFFKKKHFL